MGLCNCLTALFFQARTHTHTRGCSEHFFNLFIRIFNGDTSRIVCVATFLGQRVRLESLISEVCLDQGKAKGGGQVRKKSAGLIAQQA